MAEDHLRYVEPHDRLINLQLAVERFLIGRAAENGARGLSREEWELSGALLKSRTALAPNGAVPSRTPGQLPPGPDPKRGT